MMKRLLQLLCLSLGLLPILAHGGENARVQISLREVPIVDDIETQIWIAWGAELPRPPAGEPTSQTFFDKGGRSTGTLVHTTDSVPLPAKVDSFIIYGRIVNQAGTPLRFIPAKRFDVPRGKSLNQLEVTITPRKTFQEAFLDSYPLEYGEGRDFLNDQTIRPTLRAFRELIIFSGATSSEMPKSVWNSVFKFFQYNIEFFKRGGQVALDEILAFLRTYSSPNEAPFVAEFYAEVLNELVGVGRVVGSNQNINDYIHSQLMLLYETRLPATFIQADRSLQKFDGIDHPEQCISLAERILKSMDKPYILNALQKSQSNLLSILVQTTVCGQRQYAFSIDRRTSVDVDSATAYLAKSALGRRVMDQYIRVCEVLAAEEVIRLRSVGRQGEIAKFYIAYNTALAAGGK